MLSEILQRSQSLTNCSCFNSQITQILDRLQEFEQTAGIDYQNAFSRIELHKGDYLVHQGAVVHHLWLLETGFARLFLRKNGQEITASFFFPGEFVDSYPSSTFQTPSTVSIQLLSDAVLYCIKWNDLNALKNSYPLLSEIEKMLIACNTAKLEERIYSILSSSAQERYEQLINTHPHYIQQIPLALIASFLGIKRETLSRIRAKTK